MNDLGLRSFRVRLWLTQSVAAELAVADSTFYGRFDATLRFAEAALPRLLADEAGELQFIVSLDGFNMAVAFSQASERFFVFAIEDRGDEPPPTAPAAAARRGPVVEQERSIMAQPENIIWIDLSSEADEPTDIASRRGVLVHSPASASAAIHAYRLGIVPEAAELRNLISPAFVRQLAATPWARNVAVAALANVRMDTACLQIQAQRLAGKLLVQSLCALTTKL